MSADRWGRLSASLAAAGIASTVTARRYAGRTGYGVSRSIYLRSGADLVVIRDLWWRKNDDTWLGWVVSVENSDSIVTRDWPPTKKRGEVVARVRVALALEVGR